MGLHSLEDPAMESMNLLDITIKYFNVIVFVMCIIFGMISLFASWIVWRELHRKRNMIRGIIAAYNIAEDAQEKGRTPTGGFDLDPAMVQTIFNSIQEILNAIYGEVTGKPIPAREDRGHGRRKSGKAGLLGKALARKKQEEPRPVESEERPPVPDDPEHPYPVAQP